MLGLEGDECFSSHKVANIADIYSSNYHHDGTYKADGVSNLSLQGNKKFSNYRNFKSQDVNEKGGDSDNGSKKAGAFDDYGSTTLDKAKFHIAAGNSKFTRENGKNDSQSFAGKSN